MDGGNFLVGRPAEHRSDLSRPVRVHFHGRLKKQFGDSFDVGAEEISSILRVLFLMVPGLRQEMAEGRYRLVRGKANSGDVLDLSMLRMRMGEARALHIFPVAAGAGGRGIGKDILGAALIVGAVALGPLGVGADIGLAASTASSLAVSVGLMGASLLLGGISEAISPQPGLGASYLLNGQVNTSAQGVAIPLVYGMCRVGTVLVSSSYSAEDYTTATSDYQGYGAFISNGGFTGNTGALDSFDSGNPLPTGAMGLGGGGGKGSSPSSSGGIEAPNTLESKAIVRLVHVISEGPIGGLVNGPQSMFFGQTQLQDTSGGINFRGVAWDFLQGTPDQAPVPGYPSITETNTVGIQVFASTPVIQTIVSTTADRARITITIPAMFDTNTQNGDINPSSMQLEIAIQPAGGSYSTVVNDVINGKCTSPYQKSYVIGLPQAGTPSNPTTSWNVKITKVTPDPSVSTTQNSLYWAAYDVITDYQLTYGDTSYIALTLDSEAFGSSLPNFTVVVNGIECQVPANYTPAVYNQQTNTWTAATYASSGTGTSNGTWDGVTFHSMTTSNPAWVLYDFISNNRYGMELTAQQLELVKYQLYQIGIYADGNINSAGAIEMLPDGYGNFEPRYSLNGVLSQQATAFQIMQAIAATFRGQVYWSAGSVGVTADMPQTPIKIINQADVIGGLFTYEGTSLKTRHSWANVQWQDPSYNYLPAYEPVEFPGQVAQRGIFAKDLLAFGCTSRGVARRLGEWLLYSENYQTDTVSFTVSYDKMDILPGDVVAISDSAYVGIRMGGRVRGGNTLASVNLDMVFSPTSGTSYALLVTYPDNTLSAPVPISGFTNVSPAQTPYTLAENFVEELAISSPLFSFTRASVGTYFDATGTMQTAAANQPRFDHDLSGNSLGLLIEPASANLIHNSGNGGAALGTVGTSSNTGSLPSFWNFDSANIGVEVVNITTIDGIPCVDIRFYGVPSTTFCVFYFDVFSPFTPQNLCLSAYVAMVGGSTANINQSANGTGLLFRPNNSNSPITSINFTSFLERYSALYPSNSADTYNQAAFDLIFNDTVTSVDITLRFGGIQVEVGAVPSSLIETTTGAVSRAADNIGAFFGAGYYAMAGTLIFAGATASADSGAVSGISMWNAAAHNDGVTMLLGASSASASVSAGGVVTNLGSVGTAPGNAVRQAVSWGNDSFQWAVNGDITGIANDANMLATNLNNIGLAGITEPFYLREIAFYPFARTGDDLAGISVVGRDPTSENVAGPPYTQVELSTELTQIPAANAVFILTTTNLAPTEWQVIGIQETQPGQFRISAIQYDINKYQIIESNLTFNIPPFSNLAYVIVTSVPSTPPINTATGQPDYLIYDTTNSTFYEWVINSSGVGAWVTTTAPGGTTTLDLLTAPIPAPYNITVQDFVIGTGTTTLIRVAVSWTCPTDNRIQSYQVAVVNSVGVTVKSAIASGSFIDIDGLSPDTYSIGVRSLSRTGQVSAWAYTSTGAVVTGKSNTSPDAPTNFTAVGSFQRITLNWTAAVQRDVTEYLVWRSTNNTAPDVSGTLATIVGRTAGTQFVDTDVSVLEAGLVFPYPTQYYWLQSVTTTGVQSGLVGPASSASTQIVGGDISLNAIQTQLFAHGISPIGIWDSTTNPTSLSDTGGTQVVYNVATNQTLRWNGSAFVDIADAATLTGLLSAAQIATTTQGSPGLTSAQLASNAGIVASQINTITSTQISGTLTASQIQSVTAAQVTGQLIASQIASVDASAVSGTLTAAQIASVNASAIAGTIAATQIAAIPTTQLSGTLAADQIASLAASQITGTLTASQIASVTAAQVTGTLVAAQIASVDASVVSGTLTAAQIASVNASAISGTIESSLLALADTTNICLNPLFTAASGSTSPDGWGTYDSGTALTALPSSATGVPTGANASTVVETTARNTIYYGSGSGMFPVNPGEVYYLAVDYAGDPTNQVSVSLVTYTASGAQGPSPGTPSVTPSSTWQTVSGQATIPSGVTDARIFIIINGADNTALPAVYFTRCVVRKAASIELLVPGSITSELLASNAAITAAQIASVNASAIAGTIAATQIAAIPTSQLSGTIAASQIASLAASQITGTLTSSQIASVTAAQVTGTLVAAQIASVDASAISGTIQAAQIAAVNASVIAGTIAASQIAAIPTSQLSGTILAAQIAAVNASVIAGTIASTQIGPIPTTQLSGQITAGQITANSISSNEIQAGSIVGSSIAGATITGTNIAGQTVTSGNIAAGTIQASNIAAGAITTAALAVGTPSNICWNPEFAFDTSGWTIAYAGGSPNATWFFEPVLGSSYDPTWTLTGESGAVLYSTSPVPTGEICDIAWKPNGAQAYSASANPGDVWSVQAEVISSGCQGQLFLFFFDSTGAAVGTQTSSLSTDTLPANGQLLSNYQSLWVKGTAPANTAFVTGWISFQGDGATGNAFAVATRFMLGLGNAGQTGAAPWAPGGVTQITGGVIKTGTIVARNIAAATITATQIAAGTITASQIAAATITGGNIEAGTITGANLVAGTITATQIASQTITAAQIAALTITAAQIAANTITASQIQAGTITSTQIGASTITSGNIAAGTIQASNIAAATITGAQIAGQTITGSNIVAGTLTALQIASSTITSGNIAAGTIQASNIAAGAITTAALAVGTPSNICWNPEFAFDTSGWTIAYAGGSPNATWFFEPVLGSSYDPTWTLTGESGAVLYSTSPVPTGEICDIAWKPNGAQAYSASAAPGDVWSVQANVISSGCQAAVYLYFFDSTGAAVGAQTSPLSTDTLPANGQYLSNYQSLWVKGTAPANTAFVTGWIRFQGEGSTGNAFAVATRFMLGLGNAGQTGPAPWAPGGVTQITGGVIKTGTIVARNIAAATITAAQIAAGTITASQIAAATITGGNIEAGTITGANLVAGTITATQIASQTITAAQIAALTITAAQIAASTITASQIQAGTITSTQIAASTITSGNIAAGTIQASNIAAGTITGDKIAGTTITGSNVVAGTLTALQIAAATITTTQIAAGTILASNIAAATITGTQIAAQTIQASNLTISDPSNICLNPNFLAAATGTAPDNWSTFNTGTGVAVTALAANASGVPSGANAATVMMSTARNAVYGVPFPVQAGGSYYLAIDYAGDATNPISANIVFFNAAGTNIGAPGTTSVTPSTTWATVAGQVVVPTGAVTGQIYVIINGTANTALPAVYFTRCVVRKASSGELLVNGSIIGEYIAGNTITASNMAANSITTAALAVGSSANTIWNPSMQISINGWSSPSATSGVTIPEVLPCTTAGWYDPVEGAGEINASTMGTTDYVNTFWWPFGNHTACIPGQWYEGQARICTYYTSGVVQIVFYDASGNQLSVLTGNTVNVPVTSVVGNFALSYVIGQAPSNAAYMDLVIQMNTPQGAGSGTPAYALMFCRALLGTTVAGATQPQTYAPGGATSIVGGMIHTGSIFAEQIASQTITAQQIASGTITTNQLATGTLSANNITAGTLSAAVVLGTDAFFQNVKIQSADIGSLQVTTSNIGNGAVTEGQIGGGAVTNSFYVANSSNNTGPTGSVYSEGQFVILLAQIQYLGTPPGSPNLRLYRDGAIVAYFAPALSSVTATGNFFETFTYVDVPGVGTHNYYVVDTANTGSSVAGQQLTGLVVKK